MMNSMMGANKTMRSVAALVAVLAVLIFGVVPLAHSAEQVTGYIYDGIGKGNNNLSIVIDATTHDVEIQSKAEARINSADDGITDSYRDCGNDTFYCLTGMLEIVIPRTMPMKQWKYHDLSCQSLAQLGGDAYRITCRSPKYRGRPTYTYSLSRGVTSIDNSPVAGDYRYELRRGLGLFSPRKGDGGN